MPKISVIIPVYNVENYLEKCLESVITQTFKNIEIICINDGSTDNSAEILKKYAAKDKRIKVINQPNRGLSATRNIGMKNASGEYISFIDSDDFIQQDMYERIINLADKNADLICFGTNVFGNAFSNKRRGDNNYYKIKYKGLHKAKPELMLKTNAAVWNKIFRNKIIKKFNINFVENMHYEDFDFYCKYYMCCSNVYFLKDKLYNYYRRENSIMGHTFQNKSDKIIDHLLIFNDIYAFYSTNNQVFEKALPAVENIFLYCFDFVYHFSGTNDIKSIFELSKNIIKSTNLKIKNERIKAILSGHTNKATDKRTLLQKIFSIKNNKNFKSLNILGIHINTKRIIKFNPQPKLLVHLHLYYHSQLEYMLQKLASINNCRWDLYVTICDENKALTDKIISFKPDAKIIKIKNAGYDIWPFLQVLNLVDLKDYDYILKIHTKNQRKQKECKYGRGFTWRNLLIDALLGNPKIFNNNIYLLNENSDIGMIGAHEILAKMGNEYPEDNELFLQMCKKYNISVEKGIFVAGTMFVARAKCFEQIKHMQLTEADFINQQQTCGMGTTAHTLERMFSRMIEAQNYKIVGIRNKKYTLKNNFKYFIQKIFCLRNKTKDGIKVKQITLLGMNFQISSKT